MKTYRRFFVTGLCLVGVFMAGFLARSLVTRTKLVPEVQAQEVRNRDSGSGRCSNRTLSGAYGIKFEGQKIGFGPFASVALITFDGQGHFTTNEIGRFNGSLVQRSFTGPYTVNQDCTGFLDFSSGLTDPPHEVHGNFVIVDNGKQFYVLDNEEGWAASGVGTKL